MGATSWILGAHLAWSFYCAVDHIALEFWVNDLLWAGTKEPVRRRASLGFRQFLNICLSAIMVAVHSRINQLSGVADCTIAPTVNTDIGGIGVLLGLTVPCGFLFVMLSLGHFKSETSGPKEICIGQIASMYNPWTFTDRLLYTDFTRLRFSVPNLQSCKVIQNTQSSGASHRVFQH